MIINTGLLSHQGKGFRCIGIKQQVRTMKRYGIDRCGMSLKQWSCAGVAGDIGHFGKEGLAPNHGVAAPPLLMSLSLLLFNIRQG